MPAVSFWGFLVCFCFLISWKWFLAVIVPTPLNWESDTTAPGRCLFLRYCFTLTNTMRTTPCCFCVSLKPYFQVCGPGPGSGSGHVGEICFKKSFLLTGIGILKWCVCVLLFAEWFLSTYTLLPLNKALQLDKIIFSENSTFCRKLGRDHFEWGQLSGLMQATAAFGQK